MDSIVVHGLTKSYQDIHAVRNIDFSVKKGELFAFLGPNGAGKSTTINILCTLLPPDSGDIRISGFDLLKQPDQVRRSIGVVFQNSLLDNTLTVRENLMCRAGFYYRQKTEMEKAIRTAAEAADITGILNRTYGQLSGGQRRRTDIARALLSTPQILFLDEPTAGLDPQTRRNIHETIRRLQKEKGMTVFLTTHYLEEAENADKVVIIDSGKIAAHGTVPQLKKAFSTDVMKLVAKDCSELEKVLSSFGFVYENRGNEYLIRVENACAGIPVLTAAESCLETFEVLHGSLDDVYVAVTGKEIRE